MGRAHQLAGDEVARQRRAEKATGLIDRVGLEDGQLTADQCRLLKGLVEHQASGLVFMPGA